MEQKVIITSNEGIFSESIALGWRVKSVTAQHLTSGYNFTQEGNFYFLLERDEDE